MKDNNFNFNQVFLNTLDSLTSYKFSIGKGYASEQLLSFLHLNNISANISEKSLSLLLAKGSFAFLLISMLSYWFQMSFKSQIVMDKEILNPLQIEDLSGTECVGSPVSTDIDCKAKIHSYNSTYSTKKAINCSTTSSGTLEGKPPHAALNLDLSGYASETDRKNNLTYLLTKLIDGSASAIIFKKVPLISMWSANITLALLLSIRWIESGHFPLSNLYESLIFLSWSLTVIHLFLENLFNKNSLKKQILGSLTSAAPEGKPPHAALNLELSKSASSGANPTLTLGAITSPVALFTNAFATFSLPQEMQKVTVLVPALKSNWLIMHVSVMIISYAALLSGSLLAMAFLVIKFIDELRSNNVNDNKVPSILSTFIHSVRKLSTLTQLIDRGFVSDAYPSGIPKGVKPRNKKQFFPRKPLRGTAVPQKGTAGMRERGNANSLPQFVNTITSLTQLLRNSLFLPNSSASYSSSSISSASCAKQSVGLAQLETFQHIPQRGNTSTGVKAQYLPDELVASEICNNWQSKDKFPATQTHIAQREKACVAGNQQSSSVTVRSKAPYKSEICMGSTSAQRLVRRAGAYPSGVPQGAFLGTVAELPLTTKNKMLMDLPQILDNLSYRSIGLGFALLTIGILSGAVWANEAWGSYWSWDPKETWAFITWLVFALYLHTRLSKGWVGKESAFVASFGFIVIWFCYLGVNLFGKGLHSYGWFQQ